MKAIFSYCLLNWGGGGAVPFTWKQWTQLFYCTMKFVFKNVKLLTYAVKDKNSRCL